MEGMLFTSGAKAHIFKNAFSELKPRFSKLSPSSVNF
jgi:hypothetical protein